MKIYYTIFFLLFSIQFIYSKDSLTISQRIDNLESKTKFVENNQLNYKIEKDLLKETYSNNFENFNKIISIILGVVGILGFLGIKDINSIKKEYVSELDKLREIQLQFKYKSQELESNKSKLDEDLKKLINENEIQNRRIKFIELKGKIPTLLKEHNLASALEYCNIALDIVPDDVTVLNYRGGTLCKLNQLIEAVETFEKAIQLHPNDLYTKINAAECFYFAKEYGKAEKIITNNNTFFEAEENRNLKHFFEVIKKYNDNDIQGLKEIANNLVTADNLNTNKKFILSWNMEEALFWLQRQHDSDSKFIARNLLWYLDAQINGNTLLTRLELPIPTTAST